MIDRIPLAVRRRACRSLKPWICGVLLFVAGGCHARTVDDYVRAGDADVHEGRDQEATIEFRRALRLDPRRGDIRLRLGDAFLHLDDVRAALQAYVRAADLLPGDADAQLKAGELLLKTGQFADARARAERALAIDDQRGAALTLRGRARSHLNDVEGAIEDYEAAIARDSTAAGTAYINLGWLRYTHGQYAEAESTFRVAVSALPFLADVRLALANFFWVTHRPAESEDALKGVLDVDVWNVDANRALARLYIASGRAAQAEPYFRALAAGSTDARLTLAQYYIAVRRFDRAREVLEDLVKTPEAADRANVRLALLDAAQGNRDLAYVRVRSVLARRPRDVDALLTQAALFHADRKIDHALAAVKVAMDADGTSAAVHMMAARLYSAADRTSDAITEYERVLSLDPTPYHAALELTRIYLAAGQIDRALTYGEQALAVRPRSTVAHDLVARIHALGDVDKSAPDIAAVQRALPLSPEGYDLAGLAALAIGDHGLARGAYDRALDIDPDDLQAVAGLAQLEIGAGRGSDALGRIDAYMTRTAPSTDVLFLAARIALAAGESDRAGTLLSVVIDREPHRVKAYAMLADLAIKQGRLDSARAELQRALPENSRLVPLRTMIAMLLEAEGRRAEAEVEYQRVLAIDPRAAVAANNLAWLYVAEGRRLDDALQHAQDAVQRLPNNPYVNDTLGWIFCKKHMASRAIPLLESSARMLPQDAAIHYHLGMAYREAGNAARARDALLRATALSGGFDGVQDARRSLAAMGR
jgi:tetratricopeptide (TPR) repeat protein